MAKEHHSARWKRLSKRHREEVYFCEVWLSLGKMVKGDHVDHIIRIIDGGAIWMEDNWMVMSDFWHGKKTGAEQLDQINIPYIETEDGKVPTDRNHIINFLAEKYKKDILDFIDGYRTI